MQKPSKLSRFIYGIGHGIGVLILSTFWAIWADLITSISLKQDGILLDRPLIGGPGPEYYFSFIFILLITNAPYSLLGGIALSIWGGNNKGSKGYLSPILLGILAAIFSQVPFMVFQMYLDFTNTSWPTNSVVSGLLGISEYIVFMVLLWWGAKRSYFKWYKKAMGDKTDSQ